MSQLSQELTTLSKKIDLLLKLNTDFDEFARKETEQLCALLDKTTASTDTEANMGQVAEHVKELLHASQEQLEQETRDTVEGLERHRDMANVIQAIEADSQKEELAKLLLEEAGDKEDFDTFKTRIAGEELERRREFKEFVTEAEQAIKDGSIIELEAFLEDELAAQAEERLSESDEDENEDFDEEDIKKMLAALQQPYDPKAEDK